MKQTLALFFCLMIVGSHVSASLDTLKSQQSIVGDIQNKNSEFYSMLEEGSQYVVDEVLSLLKNLEDAAKNDLAQLIKAWQKEKALLTGILKRATQVYNAQVKLCNHLEAQQHALEHAIAIRYAEIKRNIKHQQSNKAQIQKLKKLRCKGNIIYVNHIIAHRDAILLFNLLIKAISTYKPGTFIEIENLESTQQKLSDYINHYAKEHSEEFNQTMMQLTESIQIEKSKAHAHKIINRKQVTKVAKSKVHNFAGNKKYKQVGRVQQRKTAVITGHIDNVKGVIHVEGLKQTSVRALANVKGGLTKILETLLANEKSASSTDKLNEAKANQAFASVKSQLQDESRRLARRNELLHRQIRVLKVRLARKIRQVRACRKQEARLLKAKQLAQKHLDDARAKFRARKAVLLGEIALFHRLYVYYKQRVYSVATKADKERVQDFVDHHNLKRTGRTRKAAKFNALTGHVKSFAKKGAAKEQRFLVAH